MPLVGADAVTALVAGSLCVETGMALTMMRRRRISGFRLLE
jgi:hypothetical protein